jgi:hypothetical protein
LGSNNAKHIVVDSQGNVYTTWMFNFVRIWKASDQAWGEISSIPGDNETKIMGGMFVDKADNVHFLYSKNSPQALNHKIYRLDSNSWGIEGGVSEYLCSTGQTMSFFVDESENIHVAWWQYCPCFRYARKLSTTEVWENSDAMD